MHARGGGKTNFLPRVAPKKWVYNICFDTSFYPKKFSPAEFMPPGTWFRPNGIWWWLLMASSKKWRNTSLSVSLSFWASVFVRFFGKNYSSLFSTITIVDKNLLKFPVSKMWLRHFNSFSTMLIFLSNGIELNQISELKIRHFTISSWTRGTPNDLWIRSKSKP